MKDELTISDIYWEYEDMLPELSKEDFDTLFKSSRVNDGVRIYPYVLDTQGNRVYISNW